MGVSDSAWGWGLATVHATEGVLDAWYPSPALGCYDGTPAPANLLSAQTQDANREVRIELVRTEIDLSAPPQSVPDAYLRLHLLSHRLKAPHTINLQNIFGVLPNVIWTSQGPCATTRFEDTRIKLKSTHGHLTIHSVDKFPRMVDYVTPTGVRIADADRVRLGAHLAEGTTVMHEGFVNFNAGTLGASMVEGRISAGVVVGDGSDIGGGASIMGTLSGGGTQTITIGRKCLLGAESGIGISLGDNCVVEAGLYITAGTKVTLSDGTVTKAVNLSGQSDLLYIRDSTTGVVKALPRQNQTVELNDQLHKN